MKGTKLLRSKDMVRKNGFVMMVVLCVIANLMTLMMTQSQILIKETTNLKQAKLVLEKKQFHQQVYMHYYEHRRELPWQDLITARYSFVRIDPYTIEVTIDGQKTWLSLPEEMVLCQNQIE